MATGIVSTAAKLLGFSWLAVALFVINLLAFAVLSVMMLLRLTLFNSVVMRDLRMHGRGAGYFTIVAGVCVIGVQVCFARRSTSCGGHTLAARDHTLALHHLWLLHRSDRESDEAIAGGWAWRDLVGRGGGDPSDRCSWDHDPSSLPARLNRLRCFSALSSI